MLDIAVVSGTYNRISSLQRMIESARQSRINGLTLEFWLVDGGSNDGTIEWCKTQSDIHLIEHGQLLGAVKAFNDGAFASTANYVILANDDIEFMGQSILTAFLYMQTHLDCGIGCFYQDRERQNYPDSDPNKWYVSSMPVAYRGRQNWMPYGQVCIVPKWLGDKVKWWGEYLHTYGGDNELSCQVYELGYKVSPVPGAKISDHETQDGLRTINNLGHGADPKRTGGHHPDSYAWGRKWQFPDRRDEVTGQIMTGPTVKETPLVENISKMKHRIIYLPIYEQGWTVQKEQKRGLREALEKVGLTFEFDYLTRNAEVGKVTMWDELNRLMEQIQPTLLLTQIHNGEVINGDDIRSLRHQYPTTKFVNWNGDFWPDNLLSESGLNLARAFHLQLGINRDAIEKQRASAVNAGYWQIGYEPDGVGYSALTFCDVVFLASGYSQARQNLVKQLSTLNVNFHLYGPGWKESRGVTIYDFKEGCRIYQGGKISIGDSQWPETGFVSNRVFQALAAGGSALAHQWFKDMDKLGLIDGETCIVWNDFRDLETKIYYYLQHEDERKRIADNGQRMCLEKHSFEVRVKELFDMLNLKFEPTNFKAEAVSEGWRW